MEEIKETPILENSTQTQTGSESNPNQRKRFLVAVLFVVVLSGAVFAGIQIGKKQTPKTPSEIFFNQPTTIPATPTPDPTEGWKTYSSNMLSFKYPTDLTLQERQTNYFVLLSNSNNPQSVVVSIDARLMGNYANYEKAILSTKAGLTEIQTQDLNNGIKISGKLGPGMGQGQPIVVVLFKYQQGTIGMETTTTDPTQLQLFDQILATFKFLE